MNVWDMTPAEIFWMFVAAVIFFLIVWAAVLKS